MDQFGVQKKKKKIEGCRKEEKMSVMFFSSFFFSDFVKNKKAKETKKTKTKTKKQTGSPNYIP